MKKMVLYFLGFLFFCTVFLFANDISGTKKCVKVTSIEYDLMTGTSYVASESIYDEKGNVLSCFYYKKEGILDYKIEYKYDENGNQISEVYTDEIETIIKDKNFSGTGVFENKEKMPCEGECTYDSKGNLSSVAYKEGDKILFKKYFNYDSKNNIISQTWNDSKGSVLNTFEFTYDSKGNKIAELLYDFDGTLLRKGIYKYEYF